MEFRKIFFNSFAVEEEEKDIWKVTDVGQLDFI